MKNKKSLSIFKLINTYFLKNKIGLIFSFLTPFLFMLIFFIIAINIGDQKITLISGQEIINTERKGLTYFVNTFPAFMTLTICPISMLSLPTMNIEFRNSILLKKVKSSNISKYEYNAIVFGYFILMTSVATLTTIIIFFLFLINNFELIKHFNWLSIIFGILSLMAVTITFSMFISTFIKSSFGCQMLNVGIILISLILSGQFVPNQLLSKVEAIKYINLFSPIGYSQALITIGAGQPFSGTINNEFICSTNNVFDWTNGFWFEQYILANPSATLISELPNLPYTITGIKVYDPWQKVTAVICPFVLSGLFAFVSTYFFKWSSR